MPVVRCPGCDSRVEVELEHEGRKVACPDCDETFTVPRRSRRDDEGDDAPKRKKKKGRKKSTGPNWALIGGLIAGVVLLTVGGVVVYRMTRPKPDTAKADTAKADQSGAAQPGPVPPTGNGGGLLPQVPSGPDRPAVEPPPTPPVGWKRFTAKDNILSVNLPGEPEGSFEGESDMGVRVKDWQYSYRLPGGSGEYDLTIMILPPTTPVVPPEAEAIMNRYPRHFFEKLAKAQFVAERAATLAGVSAKELEYRMPDGNTAVCRYAFVRGGGKLYFLIATVGGKAASPADRAAFLDSIRPGGG